MGEGLDQQYEQLLEALADLVALLREHGEPAWADWLDRDRRWIQHGDAYGLEHLRPPARRITSEQRTDGREG
jgi:hypothetical protein